MILRVRFYSHFSLRLPCVSPSLPLFFPTLHRSRLDLQLEREQEDLIDFSLYLPFKDIPREDNRTSSFTILAKWLKPHMEYEYPVSSCIPPLNVFCITPELI